MPRGHDKSRAIHGANKRVRRFGRKSPGLCLTCYEFVQHTYVTNGGKVECYYCSRGIKKK